MKQGWLTTAAGMPVGHNPCPHPSLAVTGAPACGVLHTTETSVSAIAAVFKQRDAPTFEVGAGRITQLIPLGFAAAALVHSDPAQATNGACRVQIEVVGRSQQTAYMFDQATTDALAHLLAELVVAAGIPLTRPYPNAMPPLPWATTAFPRRHDGKWGHTPGWFGHVEVPQNEHWDPGFLAWPQLLQRAEALSSGAGTHQPLPQPQGPKARAQYRVVQRLGGMRYVEPVDGKPLGHGQVVV